MFVSRLYNDSTAVIYEPKIVTSPLSIRLQVSAPVPRPSPRHPVPPRRSALTGPGTARRGNGRVSGEGSGGGVRTKGGGRTGGGRTTPRTPYTVHRAYLRRQPVTEGEGDVW